MVFFWYTTHIVTHHLLQQFIFDKFELDLNKENKIALCINSYPHDQKSQPEILNQMVQKTSDGKRAVSVSVFLKSLHEISLGKTIFLSRLSLMSKLFTHEISLVSKLLTRLIS